MSTDRFEPVTDRDHGYSSFGDARNALRERLTESWTVQELTQAQQDDVTHHLAHLLIEVREVPAGPDGLWLEDYVIRRFAGDDDEAFWVEVDDYLTADSND